MERLQQAQPGEVARLPEHEVRGECKGLKPTVDDTMCRSRGRSAEVNAKNYLGCRQNAHARPAIRAQLDHERRLKNLFE